ncbi:hypothetical protein [Saccharopolyspora pogona]|uniref:hypothetical protein n=1 Tax=Saccharopolyspora pogona TaxID=333966 RepID=UPI0016832452|nr:hypothetical protein [Saccharopolyspora pogona]
MEIQPANDAERIAVLRHLHAQLRIAVPSLVVAPDSDEVRMMLDDLRRTINEEWRMLTAVAPRTLAALRCAFDYAGTGRPDQCASELVAAHRHLAAILNS